MKAVVLARGAGPRMRAAADGASLTGAPRAAASAGQKGLMPIGAGPRARPFLDYVLHELVHAGVDEICLVVGPGADPVRLWYERMPPTRTRLVFAVQPVADGTARALMAAEAFADTDPFLALNADNVYPADVLRLVIALPGPGLPAFERASLVDEGGFPAERVSAFALVNVDARGHLGDIIEKPATGRLEAAGAEALVSMNVWKFDRRIFEACRDVPMSARGEFELPEAVALSLVRGVEYQVVRARGAIIDLSGRGDVAAVERRLAGREVVL